MSTTNAIATQWMHVCRVGCLCILLVFAQAVIAEHLADPDCEEECCYLCQSHGDDEDFIASVDSSGVGTSWFSEGLSGQALQEKATESGGHKYT